MDAKLMYSPLETVFRSTMWREGRTVTAYTSGSQFQAFMRRNDDGNNYEDRITLFYPVNAPVAQGNLISYGDKIYILINRETEENHCYYKSSALACNGTITLNNGNIIGIPCYGSAMKDGLANRNNIISVIDGNMEFITEANSLNDKVKIGNTFNEYGRTWKVDNTYYKDGILHIIAGVTTDEKPYEKVHISINDLDSSYNVGDIVKLEAALCVNDILVTGTVIWDTSDSTVATIDNEGNVSFLKNGHVKFTAHWIEKNAYQNTGEIIVGVNMPVANYKVTIDGRGDIRVGYNRSYTAHLYDPDGLEMDGTWNFEIDCDCRQSINNTITGNKIRIDVQNNKDLIGKKLLLTAIETKTGTVGVKSINLISVV